MKNHLREKLSHGERCFGTWITIGNADVVDLLKQLRFDFFVFDFEHSALSWETISHMIQVLDEEKTTPLVRLASNDATMIKKTLDIGGQGVIVPFVNSKDDATKGVALAKYPPLGARGFGPRKAAKYGLDSEYLLSANEQTLVFAIAESKKALENIDDIVAIDGLDGVFFGFADFALSHGLTDFSNPIVIDARKRVAKVCEKHGKVSCIFAPSLGDAKSAVEMGYRMLALGSDTTYLLNGAKAFRDEFKSG